MTDKQLTREIIGAAVTVDGKLGPGLLEAVHEERLGYELTTKNLRFEREKTIPGASIAPAHDAVMLTYLGLSGCKIGLLINFYDPALKDGVKRYVSDYVPGDAEKGN